MISFWKLKIDVKYLKLLVDIPYFDLNYSFIINSIGVDPIIKYSTIVIIELFAKVKHSNRVFEIANYSNLPTDIHTLSIFLIKRSQLQI